MFDEVATTASVLDELHSDSVSGYAFVDRIDDIKQYEGGWLQVVSPTDAELQLTEEILDSSRSYTDAELIAIAENRTDRLLTDHGHVGEVASKRGVEHGISRYSFGRRVKWTRSKRRRNSGR